MLWITERYMNMLHLRRFWNFWRVLPDPASSAETYDGLLEDDDALEDASEDRENIFSWGNGTLNRRFAGAEPGKGEEFVGSSILGEGRRAPLVTVGGVEARVGTDGDCVRDGFRTWSVLAVIRASLGVRCTLALPWDPSETYYILFVTYVCIFSFLITFNMYALKDDKIVPLLSLLLLRDLILPPPPPGKALPRRFNISWFLLLANALDAPIRADIFLF